MATRSIQTVVMVSSDQSFSVMGTFAVCLTLTPSDVGCFVTDTQKNP